MFTDAQKSALDDLNRFMRLTDVPMDRHACWEWQGNCPDGRYGHFSVGAKTVKAHRWIYALAAGPIPDGLVIRHKCDNPKCVNPIHLEPGSLSENTRDAVERGRWSDRTGEKHPLARVTGDQVAAIRTKAALGKTYTAIAAEYGISHQQVGKIVRRENWGHI